MMIKFVFSLLLTVLSTPVFAAVTADELQSLIFDSDVAGVEAAVEEAHQQSLSGEMSYDDLRKLTIVLFRTHPDTVAFLDKWLTEKPDSPYAQTARAWAYFNNAAMVRGTLYNADTPEAALAAYAEMIGKGMDLAMFAYETAPDYVPASDAIIRLQTPTRRFFPLAFRKIVSDTLKSTPNLGTILRVSEGGRIDPFGLCESYAATITDLSVDACNVAVIAENGWFEGNWGYVAEVLDREDYPALEYARALRAIQRGTDEDKVFLIAYLDKTDLTYPWLHKEIRVAGSLSNIRYFPNWPTEFIDEFSDRLQTAVRKQLETDPFNLSLIEVAIFQRPYFKSPPRNMYTTGEYRNLMTRIAVVQPFHIENWSNISSIETKIAPDLNDKDMFEINAIAYSDHSIFAITNFMQSKLRQYQTMQKRGQTRNINGRAWPEQDEFDRTVGCRLATFIRLFDTAAEKAPERVNHVQGFRAKWNLAEVEAELLKLEVCAGIWEAPIESLYFEPTEIDRRELL